MGDNNEAFMEDFGDSFNDEGDPYQMKNARNAAEALDTSLQAPNANDFSNARLIEEVRSRRPCRTWNNQSVVHYHLAFVQYICQTLLLRAV